MAFRVEITQKALADLEQIYTWIETEQSAESAIEWFQSLSDAVTSLGRVSWSLLACAGSKGIHA